MLCLVLVVLLTATMAVPAMASSGTYSDGQYDCEWNVTRAQSYGTAIITNPNAPATLGAAVCNYVYCTTHKTVELVWSSGSSSQNISPSYSGYGYASATAYNKCIKSSTAIAGTVSRTDAYFWLNGEMILSGVMA